MKPKKVKLFISPTEIQILLQYANYENARLLHKNIREGISKDKSNPKKVLTIREFCTWMDMPFEAIYEGLEKLELQFSKGAKRISARVFISPKEVQHILDYSDYESARILHRSIRDGLSSGIGNCKKRLTIREFCASMDLPFEVIYLELEKMNIKSDLETH